MRRVDGRDCFATSSISANHGVRFRANEVRLQLSVLADNFGNLWRRLVLPANRHMVAHQPPAASRQDRRTPRETRPLLVATAGRGSFDAPPVRSHARADLGAAG